MIFNHFLHFLLGCIPVALIIILSSGYTILCVLLYKKHEHRFHSPYQILKLNNIDRFFFLHFRIAYISLILVVTVLLFGALTKGIDSLGEYLLPIFRHNYWPLFR